MKNLILALFGEKLGVSGTTHKLVVSPFDQTIPLYKPHAIYCHPPQCV